MLRGNTAAPEYDAVTGQNLNTELGLPNITKGGVPLLGGLFPGSSLGGGGSTATGLGSGGSTSVEDAKRGSIVAVLNPVYPVILSEFFVPKTHQFD